MMNYIPNKITVMMNVHFSDVLPSLVEGTSAKIPLERAEYIPLFSTPL